MHAADVAAALNVDLLEPDAPAWQKGVRIVYVPVAPDERLPKVISAGVLWASTGTGLANAVIAASRASARARTETFIMVSTSGTAGRQWARLPRP